jgi:hypothetical protein
MALRNANAFGARCSHWRPDTEQCDVVCTAHLVSETGAHKWVDVFLAAADRHASDGRRAGAAKPVMYVASLPRLSHVDQSLIDVKYVTLARWRYIATAFRVALMVRWWYAMDLARNVPTNRSWPGRDHSQLYFDLKASIINIPAYARAHERIVIHRVEQLGADKSENLNALSW